MFGESYRCDSDDIHKILCEIHKILCETQKVKRPFRRRVDNIKVCLKYTVATRPLFRQRICVFIDVYPKRIIIVILNTKPAMPCNSAHIKLLFFMDFGHRNFMTWKILSTLFPSVYSKLYMNSD